jgi:hypothetical protein
MSSDQLIATILPWNALREHEKNVFTEIDPRIVHSWVRYVFYQLKHSPNALDRVRVILQRIEASSLSVSEVFGQMNTIYAWLETHHRRAELEDVCEYVLCAAHGLTTHTAHSIQWYLDNFGFERSTDLPKLQ